MVNKGDIFKFLKTHGSADIVEMTENMTLDSQTLAPILAKMIENDWIVKLPNGKYKVKFVLDPPLPDVPMTTKYFDYSKIRERLQGAPLKAPAGMPRKWMNPYLSYLPKNIDQGERGTCVGFSTAIGTTLLYFAITKDLPTPTEMTAIRRNVQENPGCPAGKTLIRDDFGKRWKSPEFIYDRSREIGNITEPSGSYLSAAVESLHKCGSVCEDECWTSKTSYCVGQFVPVKPGESSEQAKTRILASGKQHLTNGYATVTDFEQFCIAIYTQFMEGKGGGFGLVPIDIFENYTWNGCTGLYPEPSGACVGSHAQCCVGFDLDAGEIYFKQSWGYDWSDVGGITESYWNRAAFPAFIVLDDTEAVVGHELYSRVEVSANVPCSYTINGETHMTDPTVVALERNSKYEIIAFPVTPELYTVTSLAQELTPIEDNHYVKFAFTKKNNPVEPPVDPPVDPPVIPPVTPPVPHEKTWVQRLVELILAILKLFKK